MRQSSSTAAIADPAAAHALSAAPHLQHSQLASSCCHDGGQAVHVGSCKAAWVLLGQPL